jgi:hypothetical protein
VTERRLYLSYLLRLWGTTDKGIAVWRASLEDAATGEQHGFAGIAELCAFLKREMARCEAEEPDCSLSVELPRPE